MATLSNYGGVIAKGTVTSASGRAYLSNQLMELANGGKIIPCKHLSTNKYLEAVLALSRKDKRRIKFGIYIARKHRSQFLKEVALFIADESMPMLKPKYLYFLAHLFNLKVNGEFYLGIYDDYHEYVQNADWVNFYHNFKQQLDEMKGKPASAEEWGFFYYMIFRYSNCSSLIETWYSKGRKRGKIKAHPELCPKDLKTINCLLEHKNTFSEEEWLHLLDLLKHLPINYDNRQDFVHLLIAYFESAYFSIKSNTGCDIFFFLLWMFHSCNYRLSKTQIKSLNGSDFAVIYSKLSFIGKHGSSKELFDKFLDTPFEKIFEFLPNDILIAPRSYRLPFILLLATGGNIRDNIEKIPFTKKMAHLFTENSNYVFVLMKSFGADDDLATFFSEEIFRVGKIPGRGSSLIQNYEKYFQFLKKIVDWDSEIRAYCVTNGQGHFQFIRTLMGYIRHLIQDEPNFSLKGRTAASFIRLSEEYYRQLEARRNTIFSRYLSWTGADYEEFETELDKQRFKIIQLKTQKELSAEGSLLRHCVGGYSGRCYHGELSIWSLRSFKDNTWQSEVTIEVRQNRNIMQAKAKHNSKPNDKFLNIIKDWAKRENLTFVSC